LTGLLGSDDKKGKVWRFVFREKGGRGVQAGNGEAKSRSWWLWGKSVEISLGFGRCGLVVRGGAVVFVRSVYRVLGWGGLGSFSSERTLRGSRARSDKRKTDNLKDSCARCSVRGKRSRWGRISRGSNGCAGGKRKTEKVEFLGECEVYRKSSDSKKGWSES